MRGKRLMLVLGLLTVIVAVAAMQLGGNLGRGGDHKEFPPHSIQQ